jgi:hypothetical protein
LSPQPGAGERLAWGIGAAPINAARLFLYWGYPWGLSDEQNLVGYGAQGTDADQELSQTPGASASQTSDRSFRSPIATPNLNEEFLSFLGF